MVEPVIIITSITLLVSLFMPISQMIGRIKKSSCGACQVDIGTPPQDRRDGGSFAEQKSRSVDNISKE
jgi:hypothetical protein